MRQITCFLLLSFMFGAASWAQTAPSACAGDSCPGGGTSSIDLLKKSFSSSSQTIQGVSSSTGADMPSAISDKKDVTPALAPVAAPAATIDGATLDMPLTMGETVQSVQTTVKPVRTPAKVSPAVAQRVEAAKKKRQASTSQHATPTEVEQAIEKENSLLPPSSKAEAASRETAAKDPQEEAADAELEYAVKQLEQSKEKAASSDRRILPSASQNRPAKTPLPNRAFDPNAYRPGVTWIASKSNHFDIYTQKRTEGIPSANMSMTFESSYQTLSRFIPWMMSGRVRVFVYQDRASYLRYEPNALAWSRAVAYPTRGEVVVYDEPGKQQDLKESFTHELTHIFTQQFFDSHKTGQLMTPLWLDEGLAVMMEDHAYNGSKGGPWANDFNTLNFQRNPGSVTGSVFGSNSKFNSASRRFPSQNGRRKRKPLFFVPFEDFMQPNSLHAAEGNNKTQDWYFQAYTMVRFLLNPSGSASPSNRMQFEQFTRLLSQGEPKRNPSTGFLLKDSQGKTLYEPYSVEKALSKAYHYNTIATFEDNFWRWADKR